MFKTIKTSLTEEEILWTFFHARHSFRHAEGSDKYRRVGMCIFMYKNFYKKRKVPFQNEGLFLTPLFL